LGSFPGAPLARGFLAGNRDRQTPGETTRAQSDQFAQRLYYQESDFAIVDRVTQLAHKRGVSNAQIALAWMLHRDGIIAPIIGATKPHHLDESIKALQVKLDREEIEALEEPYQPHPILGID
jgi:aryl-alcohol dehydrogenase (NADP+)